MKMDLSIKNCRGVFCNFRALTSDSNQVIDFLESFRFFTALSLKSIGIWTTRSFTVAII